MNLVKILLITLLIGIVLGFVGNYIYHQGYNDGYWDGAGDGYSAITFNPDYNLISMFIGDHKECSEETIEGKLCFNRNISYELKNTIDNNGQKT